MELTVEDFMNAASTIAGNMFLNMVMAQARAQKLEAQLAGQAPSNQQPPTNGERAAFIDANA